MLLKYVTIILLCIAGETSCTIVHMQIITQMNTAVTTTTIYASDSRMLILNNTITDAIYYQLPKLISKDFIETTCSFNSTNHS